ncbi:MAG TPA: hypothetical protein VNR18_06770 [Hyphomicrobiales bacterium]|nr:hypothetical protein [Hyphomicrobiales bacterium]
MNKISHTLGLLALMLLLGACNTSTIKTTALTPAVVETAAIDESELLDIGIAVFDPGLDDIPSDREELTFGDVRLAETQYSAYLLAQTLQSTGNWGVVRVVPGDLSYYDLALRGTIVQSDGETMRLQVQVSDVTGKVWIDKEYEEVVSKFTYDPRLRRNEDSFQGLYNRIANDILKYRQDRVSAGELRNIRTIAKLQFARSFAPQAFDQYLGQKRNGILEVKRLPAADDPLLSRIETIRERDYLYVDTLQDYYGNFVRQMQGPYTDFRRVSYEEVMKYDKLRAQARRNMVLGVASILGGLAATQSSSAAVNYAAFGGLFGGGFLIKDAFNKRDEAQMQAETLAELGNSMGSDVAPHTIELDERVVTLTGSVDAQYAQWREILADIYANEIGTP